MVIFESLFRFRLSGGEGKGKGVELAVVVESGQNGGPLDEFSG